MRQITRKEGTFGKLCTISILPNRDLLIQCLLLLSWTPPGSALYRGLLPTVVRDAPFSGMYLVFFTQFKHLLINSAGKYSDWFLPTSVVLPFVAGNSPVNLQPHRVLTMVPTLFCSGGVAAGTATFLTQPFEVMRTTMQLRYDKTAR